MEKHHRTSKSSSKFVVLERSAPLPETTSPLSGHKRRPTALPVQPAQSQRVAAYSISRHFTRLRSFIRHKQHQDPAGIHCFHFDECTCMHFSARDLFLFDYGTVVFWGWTEQEEEAMLQELEPYAVHALGHVHEEVLQCVYDASRTPKIYNDIIVLHESENIMAKMTISHGMAQSAKLKSFEEMMDDAIIETEHIPYDIANHGTVKMTRTESLKAIGRLFHVRTEINLNTPILDIPEFFWTERTWLPLYEAVSAYMEISQRVQLLNQRAQVLSDLLDMLNEHLTTSHGESLEWVVVWLIVISVLLAALTIYIKLSHLVHAAV